MTIKDKVDIWAKKVPLSHTILEEFAKEIQEVMVTKALEELDSSYAKSEASGLSKSLTVCLIRDALVDLLP
jgi:hypothetical protein